MKVHELITKLQRLDPNGYVFVEDFDSSEMLTEIDDVESGLSPDGIDIHVRIQINCQPVWP